MRCSARAAAALLLFAATGTATAEVARVKRGAAGALEPSYVVGWYRGVLSDGVNDSLPAGTRFAADAKGGVRGSYVFYTDGAPMAGRLDDCRMSAPQVLACRWHDTFGEGSFAATFSTHYQSFEGRWGDGDSEPSLPWDGHRIECSEAQQARASTDVVPTSGGEDEICTLD